MADLTRYTAAPAGVGATTDGVQFTGRVYTWDDVPGGANGLPGPALVEAVVQMRGARRTRGGLVQVRHGYRAHPSGVAVMTYHRPLTRRADGRLAPVGQWALHTRADHSGTPRVTRGTAEIITRDTTGAEAPTQRVPAAFQQATEVAAFLPGQVVAGMASVVPRPVLCLGEITQWEDNAGRRQEVTMLRLGETAAVALRAERDGTGDLSLIPWRLSQYRYSLTPTRHQIGASR